MKRIAFVIPWFGPELLGGAERLAYETATRLAARGLAVEVLTTCCPSFSSDWYVNVLPAGVSEDNGVMVRRFPVVPRDAGLFATTNGILVSLNAQPKLPGMPEYSSALGALFTEHNIHSLELCAFIAAAEDRYDAFVFLPYLYGPTLVGLEAVRRKAFLLPCLHDETYAYLPEVSKIIHQCEGIFFNSDGELELAVQLFGPAVRAKGVVMGSGVERVAVPSSPLTKQPDRYVLYVGRRSPAKNVDLLLRTFGEFKRQHPSSSLRLKLVGSGALAECLSPLPPDVDDMGVVTEAKKAKLLSECLALAQPSENESFSRVMMEAWFQGRPVVAHQRCLATRIAVQRADGGFLADSEAEWVSVLAQIDGDQGGDLARLGKQGREYAEEHGDWDRVIDRFQSFFSKWSRQNQASVARSSPAIHQVLPGFAYGDAVSTHALFIRELLRARGFHSEIYAHYFHHEVAHEVRHFQGAEFAPTDVLIYHHSIGYPGMDALLQHRGVLGMVYHNITPAEFFTKWDPPFAEHLTQGRDQLPALMSRCDFVIADSAYNASELVPYDRAVEVLALPVDPLRWDVAAAPEVLQRFKNDRLKLLFVGRVSPNKGHHALLDVLAQLQHLTHMPQLIIAGSIDSESMFGRSFLDEVKLRNLDHLVTIVGHTDDATLHALYRSADVYLSMSEHEGLGVPLVEAMWFELPIVALARAAVAETLGDAALLSRENDPEFIARQVIRIVKDPVLRKQLVAAQRKRRVAFSPATVAARWLEVLEQALNLARTRSPRRGVAQRKASELDA